jgi:hypothetical protein
MTANLGLSWQRAKSDGAQDESKHRPISATLKPLDLAQSPDAFAFCYLLICVKTRLPSVYTNEVIGKNVCSAGYRRMDLADVACWFVIY